MFNVSCEVAAAAAGSINSTKFIILIAGNADAEQIQKQTTCGKKQWLNIVNFPHQIQSLSGLIVCWSSLRSIFCCRILHISLIYYQSTWFMLSFIMTWVATCTHTFSQDCLETVCLIMAYIKPYDNRVQPALFLHQTSSVHLPSCVPGITVTKYYFPIIITLVAACKCQAPAENNSSESASVMMSAQSPV